MYNKLISSALKKKKMDIGDKVKVSDGKEEFSGILMPRSEGAEDILVLKMDNGYNIGVQFQKGAKIELVEKYRKPEKKVRLPARNPFLPNISILACGGTIASSVDYRTGGVKPAFNAEEIIGFVPEITKVANVSGRVLFQMLSENMRQAQWEIIAKEVAKEIKGGADGVVLMHGTDVMGYTAAALSFALQELPVPVVLVGAQRSTDRASCDTYMNLFCAVKAATSNIAEVMVCMHGEASDDYCLLHKGTRARKCHSSRRDAFKTINGNPWAKVDYKTGEVKIIDAAHKKRDKSRKLVLAPGFSDNVAILKSYPGMRSDMIKAAAKAGYKGIVMEGTGLGHVPIYEYDETTKENPRILAELKSFIAKGGIVYLSPQTIWGRLQMNVYEAGRDLQKIGVLGNLCDMTTETAYVKLCWALANSKSMKEAEKLMVRNIAGEISERDDTGSFPFVGY